MDTGLGNRLFEFAVKIIKYCRKLPRTKEFDVIRYQLTKSATSSGANYEEAQAASSKADFKSKIDISLREMRESNYWLRIIEAVGEKNDEVYIFIQESIELKKILGAISTKVVTKK